MTGRLATCAGLERGGAAHDSGPEGVTAALSRSVSGAEVVNVLIHQAIPALGAHGGAVAHVTADRMHLAMTARTGPAGEFLPRSGRVALEAPIPEAQAVHMRTALWFGSRHEVADRYPHLASEAEVAAHEARALLPLVCRAQPIGLLALGFRERMRFDAADRACFTAVAGQCARALGRLRSHGPEGPGPAITPSHRAEQEFLANAAHELCSPLAGITSAIELLQGGAKENPADRDRFLTHIERESQRVNRLLRSLLTLARAQTETARPRVDVFELGPLLEEVTATAQLDGTAEFELSCPPGVSVTTNRDLLEQALINVSRNAVRYTEDGRVEIAVRRRAVDGALTIDVRNAGSRIGLEDQARVFERYFRAPTCSGDGLGLGLAIAKQAVEAVGGTIELESRPGSGTTVRLTLSAALEGVA
jgi:signal transduction histidine kinase